jgi:hypothetical protein
MTVVGLSLGDGMVVGGELGADVVVGLVLGFADGNRDLVGLAVGGTLGWVEEVGVAVGRPVGLLVGFADGIDIGALDWDGDTGGLVAVLLLLPVGDRNVVSAKYVLVLAIMEHVQVVVRVVVLSFVCCSCCCCNCLSIKFFINWQLLGLNNPKKLASTISSQAIFVWLSGRTKYVPFGTFTS